MKTNTCEPTNADAYLRGEMTSVQEDEYMLHLDACPSCREHLEEMACGDRERTEIQEFFKPQSRDEHSRALDDDLSDLPVSVQQVIHTLLPTDTPDSMGRIDNFEIRGVVGSGAMGVVLKARDTSLDRVVALKVMAPTLAASGTARSRFEREAKAAAAIHHPNVVAIHGVQTSKELPYLVMSYLKGTTLQQRVDSQGPMSLSEILRMGGQIAAGLAAAHQQGVVHRDIKPSNIMLDEGTETAVITDFGLARIVDDATMTRTGVISGTPEFMSPEQARGESIDAKSDVFSLGSLLYMLCTGYPPFRAQTSFGVLRKITDEQPKSIRELNPDIPSWLCSLIDDLQQKQPSSRPTAAEVHELLDACLAHVYQPDQVALPEKYQAPPNASKPFLFRPISIGVSVMIATVTLMAAMLLLDGSEDGPSNPSGPMSTTIGEADKKSPQVYKTVDLQFPNPEKKGRLVVDINRGSIEITTHDQPRVVIDVLYPTKSSSATSVNGALAQQFSPRYDQDLDEETNEIKLDTYNQSYRLNLRIKIPKRTDLVLDSYRDGYITVSGVTGTIRAHSEHNDITLENIAGSAEAFTRNGNLEVSFRKLSPNAALDFETYNGDIDLALPRDAGISFAISSGLGTFGSEFMMAPPSDTLLKDPRLKEIPLSEYSIGMINDGGIPLRIESTNGTISILKYAKQ